MDPLVVIERKGVQGSVGVITLNDAKRLNQLSVAMMAELEKAFIWAGNARDITAVLLTGGEVFSAGARIQELYEAAKTRDAERIRAFIASANRMTNLLEDVGKLTTAIIGKYCFGGGNELAMACNIRTATSSTALFGQQEIKHGIMPGMGGTQRLPRLVGIENAMPILLGGEVFSSEHAKRIGLFEEMKPYHYSYKRGLIPREVVEAELSRFCRSQTYEHLLKAAEFPGAFSAIIEAVREGLQRPLREGLEIEQELFVKVMMTDSAQLGLRRTIEKLTKKQKS